MGNNFASEFKAAHPEEIGANGIVKVCIGGGAGFIGSHIAKKLMAEVTSLVVLIRLHAPYALPEPRFTHPIRAATSSVRTGRKTSL